MLEFPWKPRLRAALSRISTCWWARSGYGRYQWVLLSRNRVPLDAAELSRLQVIPNANELMPVWTDDYSSVWPLIAKTLNER
jgi:hypothetical protein